MRLLDECMGVHPWHSTCSYVPQNVQVKTYIWKCTYWPCKRLSLSFEISHFQDKQGSFSGGFIFIWTHFYGKSLFRGEYLLWVVIASSQRNFSAGSVNTMMCVPSNIYNASCFKINLKYALKKWHIFQYFIIKKFNVKLEAFDGSCGTFLYPM